MTKQLRLINAEDIHGGNVCSLLDILEAEVDETYLLSQHTMERLLKQGAGEILSRCACPGAEGLTLKDLDQPLLVRKLTPLEYERAMGFPDNWTNLDTIG